jgi:hypothetical protein
MNRYFDVIKNLFPHSRSFDAFIENDKRKLLKALAILPESIRHDAELVYSDLFPETTRFPGDWENTFSIFLNRDEKQKEREIIDSLWKINNGGQSAAFLENVLQHIDNDFKVVENVPLTDPRNRQSVGLAVCDYYMMVCDNDIACCDYLAGSSTFIPSILQNDTSAIYSIPDDTWFWEVCFFVCKNVYRNESQEILYIEPLKLNIIWKNIVEYLILKIKPVHTTAVVFVEWIEENIND